MGYIHKTVTTEFYLLTQYLHVTASVVYLVYIGQSMQNSHHTNVKLFNTITITATVPLCTEEERRIENQPHTD